MFTLQRHLWGSLQMPPSHIWRRPVRGTCLSQFSCTSPPLTHSLYISISCHVTHSPNLIAYNNKHLLSHGLWGAAELGGPGKLMAGAKAIWKFELWRASVGHGVGRKPQPFVRWAFHGNACVSSQHSSQRSSELEIQEKEEDTALFRPYSQKWRTYFCRVLFIIHGSLSLALPKGRGIASAF